MPMPIKTMGTCTRASTGTGTAAPLMGLAPSNFERYRSNGVPPMDDDDTDTVLSSGSSSCNNSIVPSSNRKHCIGSNTNHTPLRKRHNSSSTRESRSRRRVTKFGVLSAILLVMIVDCLQLIPTLQHLDAFRMVRSQYPTSTKHKSYYLYHDDTSLFATTNNNANQQQQQQQQQQNQKQRQQQQQQQQQQKQKQGSAATKDPFEATGQDHELFKTLAGGPALIFEMARKSMLFATNDPNANGNGNANASPSGNSRSTTTTTNGIDEQAPPVPQGRWYPHSGIADVNPNFRTQAPVMTNQGFARSIWKNARKRNKPSLWKHALRTYDRMALLEGSGDPGFKQIRRSNIHHEGAMQACAKLGLWQRALEIYHFVYQEEVGGNDEASPSNPSRGGGSGSKPSGGGGGGGGGNKKNDRAGGVYVTNDMVLSLVRATVRASRLRSRNNNRKHQHDSSPLSPEQEEREAALRKIPLDTALQILSRLTEDHGIPLVAYYLNPLAAAYQSLGYTALSKDILETMLSNRTAGEDETLNVHDLCAKDKGSYSLLVQASVVTGDWGAAVDSLNEMTNAGLYPNPRHCNMWSEISERQTRPRAVGSWKKKRDDFWTDSIR